MRMLLKTLAVILLTGATATAVGYFLWYKSKWKTTPISFTVKPPPGKKSAELLKEKLETVSTKLKTYSASNGYNDEIAFLIDMSLPSGSQRFFIYNMEKDSIEAAGLVTHGYGSEKEKGLYFSNVPGSYCTSLGKYKVGKDYQGRFGLAYKLHGLDKTNDKAFERFVVLHAHDCVPVEEIAPLTICQSQGCPTVAPAFLQKLKTYIDGSKKPLLLNIYQ